MALPDKLMFLCLCCCTQVDTVVGQKEEGGKVYYKIHWKGYPSSADSWEPSDNLENCDDLIEEYLSSNKVSRIIVYLT